MSDGRRFYEAPAGAGALRSAPAALRNREPIAEVLADWLPERGLVLEVASGTGEHCAFFAERFADLDWQPSDVHPDALDSIAAWRREAGRPNFREPIVIDAVASGWPIDRAAAVLNINMVHISPWDAALGLIAGAARLLAPGGPLILYGPWLTDEFPAVPSNVEFDRGLRRRDRQWGLRRVEEFSAEAERSGLAPAEIRRMPANNLMLLFRRSEGTR